MLRLTDKSNCCGCSACEQRCPTNCIKLVSDGEGFLYPRIDSSICISCDLCSKVCPVINKNNERIPLKVLAGLNPDESLRIRSSSGGIFSMLASNIISKNGVVFGARFDNEWYLTHDCFDDIKDIKPFLGSKYLQSRIGDVYKKTESLLKSGRLVLFSGTPCQVSGLHNYLLKEYENLYTVEVICHGVPSPKIWNLYLNSLVGRNKRNSNVSDIVSRVSFRNKSTGWEKYSIIINKKGLEGTDEILINEEHDSNLFIRGFLRDLFLRPSCYHCPAKAGSSNADITIGDFWNPPREINYLNDDKGLSMVLIYSKKGEELIQDIPIVKHSVSYSQALSSNDIIIRSVEEPLLRKLFWALIPFIKVSIVIKICDSNILLLLKKSINKLRKLFSKVRIA